MMDGVNRGTELVSKSHRGIFAIKTKSLTDCEKISIWQPCTNNSHNIVGI